MAAVGFAAPGGTLDRTFHITERGSSVRTEIVGGVTTWLTMAYILFVNPSILGLDGGGLAFDQVLTVTALVAGLATIAMGVYANYPFALAAGLGLNAFVAFSLVVGQGLSFPQAMGVIVAEGVLITVLVLTGLRESIMNAIPLDLKRAIGIGIGAFIALIGFVEGGLVTNQRATPLAIAEDLTTWRIAVFVFGLVVTEALVARRTKAALLIGIVGATVFAVVVNEVSGNDVWGATTASLPTDLVSGPDFGLVGNFSFDFVSALGFWTALAVVVTVMLSDFFDTMGTAVGLGGEAGLLDENGRLPGMKRVLLVDSLAAVAGGAASSSSNTTFIESASGISDGARTGLASVVTGVLFLLCLFLSPIASTVPAEATGPVLVIVGYFMMQLVGSIDWRDPGIGVPAFLTMVVMPFTFSITNGVGAGLLSYVVIAVVRGRGRDVHPLLFAAAAVFAWYFVHGAI